MSASRSPWRDPCPTAPAAVAARRASGPCPTPSTTASSIPPGTCPTTARSPLTDSPDRARSATPSSSCRSTTGSGTLRPFLAQPLELVAPPPLRHRHGRPAPRAGVHAELVHEPPRPGEAEAEAAAGAVAVAERCLEVADAGAGVLGDDDEPGPVRLLAGPHDDLARADVHDDVARDLGDGRGQQRRVGPREPEPLGQRASLRPRGHEVRVAGDADADLILHRGRPPARAASAARAPRRDRAPPAAVRGSAGSGPWRWPPRAGSRRRSSWRRAGAPSGRWSAAIVRRRSR